MNLGFVNHNVNITSSLLDVRCMLRQKHLTEREREGMTNATMRTETAAEGSRVDFFIISILYIFVSVHIGTFAHLSF